MEEFTKYLIKDSATIKDALVALNKLYIDPLTLFVINDDGVMLGTLTDGDIRRWLVAGGSLGEGVQEAMERNFHFLKDEIDVNQVRFLRDNQITLVPRLDFNGKIVRIYDLRMKKSILPIDAVLMAGGRGERLRPLTEKIPKPLLPVGDKAIIDYNVERLLSYGVEHISITVNYLREQIEAHFKDNWEDVEVEYVREPAYLGTIGSVKFISTFYHDTVLIMNSDLFTNINYEDFYLHFRKSGADMSVAAVPYSHSIPYGVLELNGQDILGIKEKPVFNYYANAGLYLIKKSIVDLIPESTYCDATDLIDLLIRMDKKIVRFPLMGLWVDIGKKEDYTKVQEIAKYL